MEKTAYEIPVEELLDRLVRATAQAGASNSGLCFDIAAGFHMTEMQYLRGAMLARIERKKPPLSPETSVVAEHNVSEKNYCGPELKRGAKHVVARVWYLGGGEWALELKGVEGRATCPLYPSTAFRSTKKTVAA